MSAILNLAVFPLDKGAELATYVARVIDVIEASGMPYQLGPMGTAVEGDPRALFELANNCLETLQPDCERVYMAMHMDYRKGRQNGLTGKVDAVHQIRGAE